jgi:CRISPR-associated protein Cas1
MQAHADLRLLPKVRDSWSYLYLERGRVDKADHAIAVHDEFGVTPIPCATLTTLMLGPGVSITHAAIRSLSDAGCLVIWSGESGVRFYAQGLGETRSSQHLLRQAWLWADRERRLEVVFRMYRMRFPEPINPTLSLQQLRGLEGVRVREAYARASREFGIPWHGRAFRRSDWRAADPVNRALSCANSCLYGVCHAAIVSAGYSPALGFIHTGKMLSFVYDIADLYKADLTIPVAFMATAEGEGELEGRVRRRCRDIFHAGKLLSRIVPDIDRALTLGSPDELGAASALDDLDLDAELAAPGGLWDPEAGMVAGGVNHAAEPDALASDEE